VAGQFQSVVPPPASDQHVQNLLHHFCVGGGLQAAVCYPPQYLGASIAPGVATTGGIQKNVGIKKPGTAEVARRNASLAFLRGSSLASGPGPVRDADIKGNVCSTRSC
jgi:hypothetical protein